jgi:hypothetical protein
MKNKCKKILTLFILAFPFFLFISGKFGGVYAQTEEEDDVVIIETEDDDDFLNEVFGEDNIILKIFKPMNYWEGQAGIWAIGAYVFSVGFTVLFIAFIVAILIGVIKWQSSQGAEDQVRAAQKWIKNAVIGFLSTIAVFAGVNVVTWWLGIGSVYNLAENLVTCKDFEGKAVVLYEYKDRENKLEGNYDCTCEDGVGEGWDCVIRVEPAEE